MDDPEIDPDVQEDQDDQIGDEEHAFSKQSKPGVKSSHFRAYPSIHNVDTQLTMSMIKDEGHTVDSIEWVLTEKVHGANFQFILNEEGLFCGKRSGLMNPGERFHGWEQVRDIETPKVHKALEILRTKDGYAGITQITIFGELFGGIYPHKEVPKVEGALHVQKGVYYCPSVKFYAFDIFVPGKSFVTFDLMCEVCEAAGFLYSKPLQRGTFDELVVFDYQTFVTRLPTLFGLPPLVGDPNIAEGVVLRPVKTAYMQKGGRVMIKLKSDKFKEVSGMVKGVGPAKLPQNSKVQTPKDPEVLEHFTNMCRYVNENRLRSVLSKIGEVKMKDRGKLTGLLAKDAVEDYAKDVPSWASLIKEKQKEVTKKIQTVVSNLVNDNIKAIVEGTF